MEKSNIDFSKILKAQATFEKFRRNLEGEQNQAGAVQAFEFCYELVWKMMKRVLETQGIEAISPKDTFRKAALAKLLDDSEIWFNFQEKRSFIIYIYELENLTAIVKIFDFFSTELDTAIKRMQALVLI